MRVDSRFNPALFALANDSLGLRTLRATFAATALSTGATRPAFASRTAGTLRAMFVWRDFPVAVLVELLQGHAGFGDFVGVECSVVVEVEREDDRIHRALTSGPAAFAAGTTGATRTAFTPGRALTVGWWVSVLRSEETCRCTERQREEEDFCFHVVMWWLLFPCARRLHRVDAVESPVGAQKELPVRRRGRGVEISAFSL